MLSWKWKTKDIKYIELKSKCILLMKVILTIILNQSQEQQLSVESMDLLCLQVYFVSFHLKVTDAHQLLLEDAVHTSIVVTQVTSTVKAKSTK